jgi:DNA-binding transcriptional LysR family regulator
VRLPSYIVAGDIEAGRLRSILTDHEPQIRPIYAVYPHREFLASKVRSFVDYLIEAFRA